MAVTVIPGMTVPAVVIRRPAPAATGLGEEVASRTVGITLTDTLATAQAKINAIGRLIPYGVTITIQFDNGTFAFAGDLDFSGFYGMGTLKVCSKGTTAAKHTNQPAILTITSGALCFTNNHCDLEIQNLKVIGKIEFDGIRIATVRYCYLTGAAGTLLSAANGGLIKLNDNYLADSGDEAALIAEYGAQINAADCEVQSGDTVTTVGALARYGGRITLNDAILYGTLSSETGGKIFKADGTMV